MTDFRQIQEKWQKRWHDARIFEVKEESNKPKYYCLEMFPYPSASHLHMGHVRNYTMGDAIARFKRMSGFNVLYPMGYDSFGLPAENAAKKEGQHPKEYTENAIKKIMEYQKALGNSYDWTRVIATHQPEYYKWNQYFFLKLLEKNLAYRKKASVNYCNSCQTVLANEEVEDGRCWRCENEVITKNLDQWFLRTTAYADELLDCIDSLGWSDKIKAMQKNWIGKSFGINIDFEIETNANLVLLHGYTAKSDSVFLPWLKKELEKKGHEVSVPNLPKTETPNVHEQVEFVLKHCKFDENTVLLGHSLGSVIALKVLEKLDEPIKKLILAAGFAQPGFKDKKRYFEGKFDWNFDFNKIKKNAKNIILLSADNDYAVSKEHAKYLQEKTGGEIIHFEAEAEHICGEKEPIVLENCIEKWPVFTTRPDTIFGVTFMVVSAQHPRLAELVIKEQKHDVDTFLENVKKARSKEEIEGLEKDGVFTGSYAVNPVNNKKVPVYAGNFVVADYGSGMVMAVPAHDERDFQFAKKYKIPIKVVINPADFELNAEKMNRAFTDKGNLVNSKEFNGMDSKEAIDSISDFIESKNFGRRVVQYKIRDWLVSRQRYWGTPIPVVYCDSCGIVPIYEKDLPVLLPEDVEFGEKGNPILTSNTFLETKCPKCNGIARRETDTLGGFMDSSWYFLRYCDSKNDKSAFDKDKVAYWMPVDQYVGGIEHAVGHLIYSRFFTKALRDMKILHFDEPFARLFNQGVVYKNGKKMSKSYGNIVTQEEINEKYGIDTARLFLMFIASPESSVEWSDTGIEGVFRFVKRLLALKVSAKTNYKLEHFRNKAIKEVTSDIENFKFNLAIIKLMQWLDILSAECDPKSYEDFMKMLSAFAPHFAEEKWSLIGKTDFVSIQEWPKFDESKINIEAELERSLAENTRKDILEILKLVRIKPTRISLFVADEWKYVLYKELISMKGERDMKKIISELLKTSELKKYAAELPKIVARMTKANSFPEAVLSDHKEVSILKHLKASLEEEFKCEILVVKESESQHQKAKSAMPGKVGVLVE